jgi:hypothetical protein
MPLVELHEPERIRSPVRTLLRRFADSPAIIASEREDEFKAVVRDNGIRVTLDSERNRFLFCMDPVPEGKAKRVWVGLAVLERIWAYAYSFQRFYDVRGEHPQGTLLTPVNTNSIAPAWALMNLAYPCKANTS